MFCLGPKGFFQQHRWEFVNRFSRPSLARRLCSHRLWRRSCWLCKLLLYRWLCRCRFIFMAASITFALIQQPASPLFSCLTLTSTGISLSLGFESGLFLQPDDFAYDVNFFTVELQPWLTSRHGQVLLGLVCLHRMGISSLHMERMFNAYRYSVLQCLSGLVRFMAA